jgi:hypothetical protein
MGLDQTVARPGPLPLDALLARLAGDGLACTVAMIDRQLVDPRQPPPSTWSEARLRTPSGMVTLARTSDGVRVLVFGNADAPLIEVQQRIADAIRALE